MRSAVRFGIVGIGVIGWLVGFCPAQTNVVSSETQALRARLQQEIEQLQNEYRSLQQLQEAVMTDIERLRVQETLLMKQIEVTRLNLNEIERQLQQLTVETRQLENQRQLYRQLIAHRIVTLYRMGRAYVLKLLLSLHNARRFLQASSYAGIMARMDQMILHRYMTTLHKLRQQHRQLQQLQMAYQQQMRTYQAQQRRLRAVRRRREVYLAELRRRGRMYQRALDELNLASQRIRSLMRESDFSPILDIRKFKGLLNWPVIGKVVRPFGRIRLPQTGTTILSRGISIAVPEGTPVRAVFDGKVRFAGWYTGYGKLVILDHGHEVYTLYAHNREIRVRVGQIVEKGTIIAISGQTASLQGPVLYFEIRLHARAENPMDWLRVLPQMHALMTLPDR